MMGLLTGILQKQGKAFIIVTEKMSLSTTADTCRGRKTGSDAVGSQRDFLLMNV